MSKDNSIVEKQLKSKPGAYTIGDISTATGLPTLESQYALKDLMGKYQSKLEVTENGDLIYDFGSKLRRRGAKTFQESFQSFQMILWRAFKVFYKFLIAATLLVYFVVFLVILVALIIALMSAGGGKDNRRNSGSGLFRIVGEIFYSIFRFNTHHKSRYQPWDSWGYPYQHYEPRKTHLPQKQYKTGPNENPKNERLKEKSFIASIYDFVFGPPRIEIPPLANKMEVASYLRQTQGIISVSEVQALAGWTRDEASTFMTTCITEFDGDAKVNESGTLYGEFDELIRTKQESEVEYPVEFFWDEYVPEYELTGNSKGRNAAIIGMNVFNLAFSGFILTGGLNAVLASNFEGAIGIESIMATVLLGAYPLVYSTVFFLIPFVRSFYINKMKKIQHVQNIRKRLMKVIYKKHNDNITLEELTATANDWRKTEEVLDRKTVEQTLQDFIVDLDGQGTIDDKGKVVYDFRRINREIIDMGKLRNDKYLDSGIGEILKLD